MAATLLNSPHATELSVYVVRGFVELRGILVSSRELAAKVHQLERKVSTHERNIAELADSMGQLLAAPPPPPKRSIASCRWKRRRANRRARQRARRRLTVRLRSQYATLKNCSSQPALAAGRPGTSFS